MSEIEVRTAADFMTESGGRQPDVVAPLVAAGITFLGGGVGMGKTLLGLEIAVTKASGRSQIGLVATPGRVLFVAADMAPDGYRDYLQSVVGDRHDAWQNLYFATPRDLFLDDEEGEQELRAVTREVGADLVVMDYFDRFLTTDGYHPKELRPIVSALAAMRDEDKVAILMLDQKRKQSGGARNGSVPVADELFGGRMKSALADRIIMVKKDAASAVFTVAPAKERGAAIAPMNLVFDAERGWSVDGGVRVHLTPGDEKIRSFIDAALPGEGRTVTEIGTDTRLSERAVRSGLSRLMAHGLVTKGQKAGRCDTYKSATLHITAVQSELPPSTNYATLHSPIRGVQQSSCVPEAPVTA